MQGYVCPASQQHCPYGQGDIRIVIEQINSIYKREWEWPESMLLPTEDAKDWHCKYKVEVSEAGRNADMQTIHFMISSIEPKDPSGERLSQPYIVFSIKQCEGDVKYTAL